MRTAVERGMLINTPPRHTASVGDSPDGAEKESTDLVGALWRYRWAVILPAVAGAIAGFLIYLRTPETYRSTTRLMIESDRPAILDSMSGDLLGGVPSIDIIQSQLYSDQVVSMAFDDPRMQPFRERFSSNPAKFIQAAQEAMVLEPEVADVKTAQSMVMLLHFDDVDAELCEASVKSFSTALQNFLNEKQMNSRGDLIRLISEAIEEIYPKIKELEQRYADFRRDAPLSWNADGEAFNPHRDRQLFLTQRRSEHYEELRHKQILLNQVESLAQRAKDPAVALAVIGQLLNVAIKLPDTAKSRDDVRQSDAAMAGLEIDKQLVPLMIERNKYAEEYGDNHPTVKQLDSELSLMKQELKRIVREETDRMIELREENPQQIIDPAVQAAETVAAIIYATKAEVNLLTSQIKEVDVQIGTEKQEATKLSKYEQENYAMLRDIARDRELMNQLQDQIARVKLTDNEGSTSVVELTAPSNAYLVGPMILKMLGIGTFLGLGLGAGLALLLEKNSSTFRNPDEIAELLGVPVLTHVPFFKGRIRKPRKKGELNPYKDLDPYLAVVHQPSSVVSEAIRSFRTSVFFEMAGPGGKILQVTSPLPGDGKSTIAGNLACSIAQSGKRVLAIDCDLRRPQLTDNFGLSDELGISNVLNGDCDCHEAAHQSPLPTLHVMPSGPIPANPAEALSLPDMGELLEIVREQYDFVILDTPPLLVVTDPSITASMVDGIVLTLRVRRKSKPNAKESMNILRAVGANVLGVVINNSDEAGSSDGYRGYGYYRYGRYTSRYYRRSGNGSSDTGSKGRGGARESMVIRGRGAAQAGENGQPKLATTASESNGTVNSEQGTNGEIWDVDGRE